MRSPAGLVLFSVTPWLESLPQTPPLAMSHGSKCTHLLKKKRGGTLSHEGYEEIFNSVRQ